jgi:MFS family permease
LAKVSMTGARYPARPPAATRGLVLLSLLPVLTILGVSGTGAAQEEIAAGLGESPASTAWVIVAFILALGVARPAMGRLTDLAGVRGLLIIGSIGLVIGSLGALVSTSLWTMIAARLIQGASTSAVASAAFTAIAVQLNEPARSHAFGLLTAGSSLLLGLGPIVGALTVSVLDWRASLALPLIAAPVGFMALSYVQETPVEGETFDVTGALLLLASAGCALTVIQAEPTGLSGRVVIVLAVVALATGLILARRTVRRPDGFIPLRSVRRRGLPWHLAACASLSAFAFGFVFAGPLLLDLVRPSWDPLQLGLVLAPAGFVGALAAYLSGRLTASGVSTSLLAALGAGGIATLALAGLVGGPLTIIIAFAAATSTFAGTQVVLTTRIALLVPPGEVGVVLGLFSLVQLTGGSAGAAIAGAMFDAVPPETVPLTLLAFPVLALVASSRAARY